MNGILKELLVRVGFFVDSKGAENTFTEINSLLELGKKLASGVKTAYEQVVGEAIEYGSQLQSASEQIGVSVEALQELEFAAQQSGASADGLRGALRALHQQSAEASRGNFEASRAFAQAGLRIRDQEGHVKSADRLFEDLTRRLEGIEDPARQAADVTKLLGESGAALLPMLRKGSSGVADLRQRLRDLGGELSSEQAAAANQAGDAISELGVAVNGLRRQIGAEFFGDVTSIVQAMTEWIASNREWLKTKIVEGLTAFKEGAAEIAPSLEELGGLASTGLKFFSMLSRVFRYFSPILKVAAGALLFYNVGLATHNLLAATGAASAGDLAANVLRAGSAAVIAGAKFAALGAIVMAGIGAIALFVEDYDAYQRDEPSMIGQMLGADLTGKKGQKGALDVIQEEAMQAPKADEGWAISLWRGLVAGGAASVGMGLEGVYGPAPSTGVYGSPSDGMGARNNVGRFKAPYDPSTFITPPMLTPTYPAAPAAAPPPVQGNTFNVTVTSPPGTDGRETASLVRQELEDMMREAATGIT